MENILVQSFLFTNRMCSFNYTYKKKKEKEGDEDIAAKRKNTDILESNERTMRKNFQRVTRVGGFRGQKKGSLQPFERNKVKGDFARKLIFHLRQRGVERAEWPEFKRGARKKKTVFSPLPSSRLFKRTRIIRIDSEVEEGNLSRNFCEAFL